MRDDPSRVDTLELVRWLELQAAMAVKSMVGEADVAAHSYHRGVVAAYVHVLERFRPKMSALLDAARTHADGAKDADDAVPPESI